MTIQNFARFERQISLILLPLILVLIAGLPCRAQDKAVREGRGSNVRWTRKGDVIVINYDLVGSPDAKYEVTVAMKKDKDTSFVLVPKNVEGHIGEGVTAGNDREILWYYRTEYKLRIQDEELFFEIRVKSIKGESHLLYYIAGGAAVAGGILAIIIAKNQSGGPPLVSELPLPPARP